MAPTQEKCYDQRRSGRKEITDAGGEADKASEASEEKFRRRRGFPISVGAVGKKLPTQEAKPTRRRKQVSKSSDAEEEV